MTPVRKLLQFAVPLSPASSARSQWKTAVLYTGILILAIEKLPLALPGAATQAAQQIGWQSAPYIATNMALLGLVGLAYLFVRRGSLKAAGAILVGVLLFEGALYLLRDWSLPRGWSELWVGVALGALLFGGRGNVVTTVAVLVFITVGSFHAFGSLDADGQTEHLVIFLTSTLGTLALAGIMAVVTRAIQAAARSGLRQDPLRIVIEAGQELARGLYMRTELDSFLAQTADIIKQRFQAVHHVEIFLAKPDSPKVALHAATGPVGQQLLAQEYAVDIGGLSAVGRVTLTKTPLLIPNYEQDRIHRPHPLLAETRSELAIPLVTTDEVIGALDLQSLQAYAFEERDVAVLQAIANQLAIVIDGLQLHEAAQRNLREKQALSQQTQTNLREIERLNYLLTGRAWSEYLRLESESAAMTLDLDTGQVVSEAEWTGTLQQAAEQRQVITSTSQGQRIVSTPITVRNEIIGAMEFELRSDDDLPEDALELVAAVGQRLGLALENRRLFDETQRVAQREALINDIGADLQSATGVDAIIQRAARHLYDALAAQQVTIRLGTVPADQEEQAVQGGARP
jgi:GAF domain-containing protein